MRPSHIHRLQTCIHPPAPLPEWGLAGPHMAGGGSRATDFLHPLLQPNTMGSSLLHPLSTLPARFSSRRDRSRCPPSSSSPLPPWSILPQLPETLLGVSQILYCFAEPCTGFSV